MHRPVPGALSPTAIGSLPGSREKTRRSSTPRSFYLKNRENDLYLSVELLQMKRRVFHWLLAAALADSLPLTARSVAARGMGGFAGGGSHFLAGRDSAIDPDSLGVPGSTVPSFFGSTTVVLVIMTASSTADFSSGLAILIPGTLIPTITGGRIIDPMPRKLSSPQVFF
jgi:hypothetical protein